MQQGLHSSTGLSAKERKDLNACLEIFEQLHGAAGIALFTIKRLVGRGKMTFDSDTGMNKALAKWTKGYYMQSEGFDDMMEWQEYQENELEPPYDNIPSTDDQNSTGGADDTRTGTIAADNIFGFIPHSETSSEGEARGTAAAVNSPLIDISHVEDVSADTSEAPQLSDEDWAGPGPALRSTGLQDASLPHTTPGSHPSTPIPPQFTNYWHPFNPNFLPKQPLSPSQMTYQPFCADDGWTFNQFGGSLLAQQQAIMMQHPITTIDEELTSEESSCESPPTE